MHPILAQELDRHDGLVAVRHLPAGVPRWAVFNAARAGRIERVHPGVYRDVKRPLDPLRAAALYADGKGALSHTTALSIWGLHPARVSEVHLTVAREVRLRSTAALKIHTRAESRTVYRQGFPVTPLEDSLIDAWPLLPHPVRLGCVLEAVGRRMTTPDRVATALSRSRRLPDRGALRTLIDQVARGCRSYLEIFGVDQVFDGLPYFARQVQVRVGEHTYYLDAYAESQRLDVELDGASWHASQQQRERDLRRDAALATAGIHVVRFSYQRLVEEPLAVREDLRRILRRG
jgi:very-short-patch-repair endonuclease